MATASHDWMIPAAESGCLLLADISGYTQYLCETELEHAQDVLADLQPQQGFRWWACRESNSDLGIKSPLLCRLSYRPVFA
jgi:hypothetical protein